MASPKDVPRGYFERILAIDCETTGLCFGTDSPVHNPKTGERHQTVSWGVIVARADNLKPVEKLYVEIKWNEESKRQRADNPEFGKYAEKVHGLTQKHLEQNGVTEEEACILIGNLIMKYWGPENNIVTLGHNVHRFDLDYMRDMFRRQGIELKFANRHVDTSSIGFCTWNTFNSDDLFDAVGLEERGDHNALEDIENTLHAARVTRLIFNKGLDTLTE